ncbi:MAG: Crp/Fnr family transcriptional regulator [Acidobacteria bacterium]|nr:Crp/Fnr family transcriptional regulator [Acidobacteriota bacterium]
MINLRPALNSSSYVECSNALLAALPTEHLLRIFPYLHRVDLIQGQVIHDASRPISRVYFPESCLISVLAELEDGSSVEIAQVGQTGMLGIYLALGSNHAGHEAIVSLSGTALQMSAETFLGEFKRPGVFQNQILKCIQRQLFLIAQHVACNRIHTVEQRVAWLLLSIHDQAGGAEFTMTHDFMSRLLGSTRPEVAKAAHQFRIAGYIRYTRGKVSIVDRIRLEAAVCECYRVVREIFAPQRKLPRVHS